MTPGGGDNGGGDNGGSNSGSGGDNGGGDNGGSNNGGGTQAVVPVQHVDPFVGTDDSSSPNPVPGGAGGSTYPGAVVPFGMVQLSPDTPTASPRGYRYGDGQISQFSLTHFDGAGCDNNGDLPFMPVVGELPAVPGENWVPYRMDYDKANEQASAGYYQVTLADQIKVELTATTRTGMVRLTYPASTLAQLVLHAGHSHTGERGGAVEFVDSDKIRGMAMAGGFCGSNQTFAIYFSIQFDRPFTQSGTWLGNTLQPGATASAGVRTGAVVAFDTTTNPTVQMKIGLSFVSIENADANLAAENPDWNFDAVRSAASDRWNQTLSRIEVSGGNDEDLKKFYTALYHVFQSPNVASDVNGQYMAFDRTVQTADGWTVYQNYSGWDIIRSWTHLVSAIAPEAPDIIHSMVDDGARGGLLPFWTQQNVETHVMVGDPGTVNVANAYAMGVRGFDTDTALGLMIKSATDPAHTQRGDLSDWTGFHYVDNGATTLEYAMADFAIAQFAGALGQTTTHDDYMVRSAYWKNVWNPADGFLEPKVTVPGPGADAARIYEVQVFGSDQQGDLAIGGTATASAMCNGNENPGQAINGTWTGGNSDKWCDNSGNARWLRIDLGAAHDLTSVVIYHAGAGGELTMWDTQDFTISTSVDGTAFTVAATVTGNTSDITTTALPGVNARYLRLDIVHAIQVMQPGSWDCHPFDSSSGCGFIEGNAAQYLWMVPHDLEGLFGLLGGHDTAVARLDSLFKQLNAGTNRPYFYIGNEPEHGTPWTYNFAGAPWKTQSVVRRIIDNAYTSNAGGLPGNDDLGATSAWLVWAYLGMYPVIPGTDVLVIHGPQFSSIKLHLANGNAVAIHGTGAGPGSPYIQSLSVNGTATTRSWLNFSDIAAGATLDLTMGSAANQSWGSGAGDAPPSFAPAAAP